MSTELNDDLTQTPGEHVELPVLQRATLDTAIPFGAIAEPKLPRAVGD
jgi:hypothetical protein